MRKCEVIAERVTLTVCKGSIVNLDDVQAELARSLVKPVSEAKAEKKVEVEETETQEEKPVKKTKKK